MEPYKSAGTVIVFKSNFNGDLTKHLINAFKNADENDNYCELILSESFNKPIKIIQSAILYITFGGSFNKSVNKFHSFLQELIFRHSFNKSVNYFPSSITKLVFGHNFNKSISYLPNSIHSLSLNKQFNEKINKFPKSLQNLQFISNKKFQVKYYKLINKLAKKK